MESVKEYIKINDKRFMDELFGLLRIQSISSATDKKAEMFKAAEYWKQLLLNAGADSAAVYETNGNPVTYGEKIIDKSLPTIMVYAHMDVMPIDPIELWNTDPFEPVIKDGKIWGRGADDDKGQSFMHAKAFEYLVKSGTLPCNVKFMIEGEEEIGSPNLGAFCEAHKELLSCDVILVSDTTMIAPGIPAITSGLRGLAYWQVEITGANRDLHSGIFGGAVPNPLIVLSKLIAKITDDENRITIPGFYDDVLFVSDEERELLAKRPFDEDEYKKSLGITAVQGEAGFTTIERTGIRPSFDVCGIWGGYSGEGAKTVLPSKAFAKLSCRLVPNQKHHEIAELVKAYLIREAPTSVDIKVEYLHGGSSYVCPIDNKAYIAAEKALIDVYGKRPIPMRSGGSIPIITTFEQVLGVKSVLMGFGLDSDAIHSPNENFPVENIHQGIEAIVNFYKYYTLGLSKEVR